MTLLESVIALFLVVTAALSVLALSITSTKVHRQSEARGAALAIARSKIDEVLAISHHNRGPVTEAPIAISAEMAKSLPAGSNPVATYTIRKFNSGKNLMEISVFVTWKNLVGQSENGPESRVAASKVVSSVTNANWVYTDGWTLPPDDDLFYTPPPPPTTTGGTTTTDGSSGSSSGSSSSSTTSSTTSETTTGSTSTSSTTGTPPTATGFGSTYGSKWM